MKKVDIDTLDDFDDDLESPLSEEKMGERTVWAIIGTVFLCLVIVLMIVYNREKEKPDSPQAYVAAQFSQLFNIQEWQPGMGTQPLLYHPAALNSPVWMPLPGRSGAVQPNYTLAAFG
ncbi:MAG: hypothetical protein HQK64_04420 [Desulfamplus sp.]|nr:hypothetical protein [Desulfamplus sp.]MBF0388581.1 hypothetical protein [Desulfamplus sp.]